MPALLDQLTEARERALLTLLVIFGYVLYLPFGVWSLGLESRTPDLALDHATPFVPELVFVYGLLYSVAALPLVMPLERYLFRRVALAYAIVQAVSLATFIAWPVHMMVRPELAEDGSFTSWTMGLLYWADRPSNCLPSLHVSSALLASLCTLKVDRVAGTIGILLSLAIAASTMFVKQHWFADVVTGGGLALVAWALVVRPVAATRPPTRPARLRWLVLGQLLLYGALYGLYSLGWAPWTDSVTGR